MTALHISPYYLKMLKKIKKWNGLQKKREKKSNNEVIPWPMITEKKNKRKKNKTIPSGDPTPPPILKKRAESLSLFNFINNKSIENKALKPYAKPTSVLCAQNLLKHTLLQ